MDQPVLDYLLTHIDDRRGSTVDTLVQGSVADFAEYKRLCGVIQGLDTAKILVLDLAKKLEIDDDE